MMTLLLTAAACCSLVFAGACWCLLLDVVCLYSIALTSACSGSSNSSGKQQQ
jgi:hypothetical protein